jgi:hypothetical protein
LRDGEADPAEANLKIRVNPRSLTLKESEIWWLIWLILA